MDETLIDFSLEDIEGIGSAIKQKLINGGIRTSLDLAVATPKEVVKILGGSDDRAFQFIFNAKKLLQERGVLDKEMDKLHWKPKNMKIKYRDIKDSEIQELYDKSQQLWRRFLRMTKKYVCLYDPELECKIQKLEKDFICKIPEMCPDFKVPNKRRS